MFASKFSFKQYLYISIVAIILYGIFLIPFNFNPVPRSEFSDLALVIVNILVLIPLYYAAKHSRIYGNRTHVAWSLIFYSQVFRFVGDFLWAFFELGFNNDPNISLSFIPYLISIVLLCAGLLLLPRAKMARIKRLRRIVDIGIVMVIFFMFIWAVVVEPLFDINSAINSSATMGLIIAFIITDFGLAYILIGVSLRYAGQIINRPISFLLIGTISGIFAANVLGYQSMLGQYSSGTLADFLWMVNYITFGLAAIMQIKQQQQPLKFIDYSKEAWYMNLPNNRYITIIFGIIAYLLLIWVYTSNPDMFFSILLTASLIIILVILRQVLLLVEMEQSYKVAELNERKFQHVFEKSHDSIIIANKDSKIIEWNRGASEMFGYPAREIMGKDVSMLMPKKYIKPFKSRINDIFSNKSIIKREHGIFELSGIRKDGEEFPLEMTTTYWKGSNENYLAAIFRDISERKKNETALKNSLKQKNILIKEIHHRVKNHLQIISSLINLQSLAIEEEKASQALLDIGNRVNTIAMVHENLYNSPDVSEVHIKTYINSILKNLSHTYNIKYKHISLISNVEDMYVNIETATPCGLIINELLSNSIKYAFTSNDDDSDNKIYVTFKGLKDGYLCLIISDNGVGLPDSFDINDSESLGLRLVDNLVIQLGGVLDIKNIDGVQFEITFKELDYDKRV